MQRRAVFTTALAVAMGFALGTATTANARTLGSGPHYNLNIIGFSHCTMTADGVYPDCFKGNDQPGGHVIFVPLKTTQENVCQDGTTLTDPITAAQLQKGVRILVSDGPDLVVLDNDATDGTARFQLPNGCYDIFASPGGKPGGCADIDTITCFDITTGLQENCDPSLVDQSYTAVGHIDVDRSKGKPQWDRVTDQLLGLGGSLVATDGYFDFFWQIFNDHLRVLHLRIQEISCPS
jgi:hypothetical protein